MGGKGRKQELESKREELYELMDKAMGWIEEQPQEVKEQEFKKAMAYYHSGKIDMLTFLFASQLVFLGHGANSFRKIVPFKLRREQALAFSKLDNVDKNKDEVIKALLGRNAGRILAAA